MLEPDKVRELRSNLNCPSKGNPGKKARGIWKKWRRLITKGKKKGKRTKIGIVLGLWYGIKGHSCWGNYINENGLNIWMREEDNEEWSELKKGRKWE